jgi:hypothetical protein
VPCNRLQEIDVAEFAVDPHAPAWAEFRDHYPRCAECSSEVARFATLKSALGSDGAGGPAHLSEAQLLALASSRAHAAPEERVRLEAHLAGCAPCRTELAVVRGFDFASIAAAPGRRGWLVRLGGALAAPPRRAALLAAVVVLLAVPAGVLVWRSAQETRATPSLPALTVERDAPAAALATTQPEPSVVAKTPPPVEPEPLPAPREEPQAAPAPAARPKPTQVAKQPSARAVLDAHPPEEPRALEIAALVPSETPRYAPGPLASGPSVRIGGATRGLGAGAPAPEALAPEHLGASTRESPNLYWFLPEATPSPVEMTLIDPDVVAPLLETMIPGPLEAGVHRVSLSEHGVRLKSGVDYRWFVTLVRDPARRSKDIVSEAALRFTPPGPELGARLSAAVPARAHLYAESGLWYDAFDQLSTWLAAEPGAALLREHRAALLEQVGLDDVAAHERHSDPSDR